MRMPADNTPKTTDPIAAARAEIERRRAPLVDALAALDADLSELASAAVIAARYLATDISAFTLNTIGALESAPKVVPETAPLASKPKRVSRGGKPPYTPAEDARIMEAGRARGMNRPKFEELARTMPGRTWLGLERHYQELKAAGTPTKATPKPKHDGTAAHADTYFQVPTQSPPSTAGPEPDLQTIGSEISPIVEPTSAAEDVAAAPDPLDEIDAQRRFDPEYVPGPGDLVHYPWRPPAARKLAAAVPQPTSPHPRRPATAPNSPSTAPVRDVSGPLVDGGPGDKRVYDHPEAFRSRNSD